eukprot:13406638-Ditylum_brightwellii.AAC.1
MEVCTKECDKCKHEESRGETPKSHPCPRNYECSSRAMEADASLLLTIDMYYNTKVTIESIVANDNSSMKGKFPDWSWPTTEKGEKKKSTSSLLLHVPETSWLADPTHHTQVMGKDVLTY